MMPNSDQALEEAAKYPRDHVVAIISDSGEARRAAQDLREAGFTHVELLQGREAYDGLRGKVEQHGVLGKWYEGLRNQWFDEGYNAEQYFEALREGRSVVMVHVADQEAMERAKAIVNRYSTEMVSHFGRWAVTQLPTE